MESLKDFYKSGDYGLSQALIESSGEQAHFNIMKRRDCFKVLSFTRRDYYKIVLLRGTAVLKTERGEVTIDRPALFLSDKYVRYGWRNITEGQKGFSCLFNEAFIHPKVEDDFRNLLNLFSDRTAPFLFLKEDEYELLYHYFELIRTEYVLDQENRDEMINDLLHLFFQVSIRIQFKNTNKTIQVSHNEVVMHFFRLLDQQFPIDSPSSSLLLRKPGDFAQELNVHVNYLNFLLKNEAGKTTSDLIHDRILAEAKSLLAYSDWRVSEIAQSLGFEYPQHFHAFFKRLTGLSPREFRYNPAVLDFN